MSNLTIQNLILHFENRLRQIDRHTLGNTAGKEPQFPMLVVFLGDEAIKGFPSVASNLFEIWPQYQRELQFVGVDNKGNSVGYVQLTIEDNEAQESQIASDEVSNIVTSLFGIKNHFQDRSKLFVYFILDTTSCRSAEEFSAWIDIMQQTKNTFGIESLDMLDMLMVLLNENFSRKSIASQIKNKICAYYDDPKLLSNCKSIFLLSNKRSDHAILEDWNICHRIASSIIALSNNSDANVSTSLFSKSVLTASYAREEKPSEKIGQVIVTELIDEMAKSFVHRELNLFEDDSISERLGLTKDGTIIILDNYAQSTLVPLLPSPSQLMLFPRASMDEYDDVSQLSARDFNSLTMNSWDSYLSQVARQAQEKVNMDSKIRQNWRKEYLSFLCTKFSTDELIYLSDHIDDVRELISRKREPSQEMQVLSAAKSRLKYMLSSDPKLIDIFISAIKEQGEHAREFFIAWRGLLQSRQNIFAIRDDNITAFYEKKVRNYFDHHGHELAEEFKRIQDFESLKLFLEGTLDKIVDSDSIFSAPFEEELERRLREEALPTDAKQYIRQKLTGEDVRTYLQVNFNFGQPVLSSILIKVGTSLYKNLYNNLAPTTYYYNTGCGNAAEATVVYEVSKENLINGESR